LAEKPNDIHTVTGLKLGIPRDMSKSINYAILYGSAPKKISKMLGCSLQRGKELVEAFWDSMPALKELKIAVEAFWEKTDKKYIPGIDGRKINIRSKHSIINALFQSCGVIAAKYTTVYLFEELEKLNYCIDPFIGRPDVCSMIEYHDECQLYVNPALVKYKKFNSKEEAKEFVESWEGEQLSAISEGKTWYVALPNDVSRSISSAIKRAEKDLKMNISLGFEWIVSNTWYGCH